MYIYYVLRGMQGDKLVEREGDIDEEHFPNVDLSDAQAIIKTLLQRVREEEGEKALYIDWTECDLSDAAYESEDNYIFFNDRWMRRADAPWRKDRYN